MCAAHEVTWMYLVMVLFQGFPYGTKPGEEERVSLPNAGYTKGNYKVTHYLSQMSLHSTNWMENLKLYPGTDFNLKILIISTLGLHISKIPTPFSML